MQLVPGHKNIIINTVEALLMDTLVSGQLYLWTLFSIPLFDLFPLFLMEIIPVSGQLH